MKRLKILFLFLIGYWLNVNAQSDTILFKNIGYIVDNQVVYGNLKVFNEGFKFKSTNIDLISFQQDFIALKKHNVLSDANQIQLQDLAFPIYSLEFETKEQIEFLLKLIKPNKKNAFFTKKFAENMAGEFIQSTFRSIAH